MMKKRTLLISLLIVVLIVGVVGFDLAQLQAGLEKPTEAVLEIASAETQTKSPALPITAYDHFSVSVEEDILVDVHMREAPDAMANIVMIHGAGGGAWAWEIYFEQFPEIYNLYAISWRGHFTSSPVEDADTAAYVRDQTAAITAIANRNNLPIHVIGHSYGGATSVLATAHAVDQVASLHLIAPVVPLDYTFLQAQLVPLIMPPILRNATTAEQTAAEATAASGEDSDGSGTYAGMFLDQAQMERYWDLYAGKPFSVEKPSLIAVDGLNPDWQIKLAKAYSTIGTADLPVWFLIARYDNVVIPSEQYETATEIGASITELESGHYIQLDIKANESAAIILANLNMLNVEASNDSNANGG
ncbi:MAG: alpha/beta hydrolase [Chloroflexota bacterium]